MAKGDPTAFLDGDEDLYQTPAPNGAIPKEAHGVEVGIKNGKVVLVLHQPPDLPVLIPLSPKVATTVGKTLIQASMVLAFGTSLSNGGNPSSGPEEPEPKSPPENA